MEASGSAKRRKTLPPAAAAHLYQHSTAKLGADGQSHWVVDSSGVGLGTKSKRAAVWSLEPEAVAAAGPSALAMEARVATRTAARAAALNGTSAEAAGPESTSVPLPLSMTRVRRLSSVPAGPETHGKPPPRKSPQAPPNPPPPLSRSLAGMAAAAAAATAAAAGGGRRQEARSTVKLARDEFIVRELLDRKVLPARGAQPPRVLFLVAWEGYREEEATWEPRAPQCIT